ncbi:MAG: HDOD domain-containing protein [Deltaproteobacteria bacterium]|nr:HDOD domain-containing protein [Deltaproteobacteria bacterium]
MTTVATPALRRILFVDDEPNVLDGLKNLLRKHRRRWDMIFAVGGQAALEEMAKAPVDVIVSDMRMPGMDGAELLTRVKNTYPGTVRIVLSGHAEKAAIARVISVAHQFLSKPCDAETVRVAIERTCEFQLLLNDDGVRSVVGSLECLPSLPETYWELTRATENPDMGLDKIAAIVEKDPAISLKVLQLVNSAYFGLAQETRSILKAVSYLGIENLKGLLILAHVFGAGGTGETAGFSLDDMRNSAVLTATLARRIVRDRKVADDAFSAGLLHDVGKLVLARDKTRNYSNVVSKAQASGQRLDVVEKQELGTTHAIVGAYLLGVWGLPYVMAETVAFHHCPSLVTEGNCDILAAVHIADGLAEAAIANSDPLTDGNLDMAFVERIGMSGDLAKWRDLAAEAVAEQRRAS